MSSRQKQVKNGSTSGRTPAVDWLAQHPLYDELLAIGRYKRTIRPEALLGCPHLLRCDEVVRRTPTPTNPTQLAVSASKALYEAIEAIVMPTTREVAEAALCTRPEFEGLQIGHRIHKLPGIDDSSFKRHRRRAFAHIIAFLTRRTPVEDSGSTESKELLHPIVTGDDQTNSLDDFRLLSSLASSAARVHYAGLGTLFIHRFDRELSQQSKVSPRSEAIARTSIAYRLFSACVAYFYSTFPQGTPPYFLNARFADEFLQCCAPLQLADRAAVNELVTLWRIASESTPLAHPDVTLRERASLIESASKQGRNRYFSMFSPQRRWQEWLEDIPLDTIYGPFTNAIARLVSTSGMFLRLVRQSVNISGDVYASARQQALTAIEDSYWHADPTAIVSGKSIAYFADSYLEEMSTVLTNRAR